MENSDDIPTFVATNFPVLLTCSDVSSLAATFVSHTEAIANEIIMLWKYAEKATIYLKSVEEKHANLLSDGYEDNMLLRSQSDELRNHIITLETEKSVLANQLATSETERANLQSENVTLQANVETLQNNLQNLGSQPQYQPQPHTQNGRSAEHPDPDKFDGSAAQLRPFLTDMSIKLTVNKDWYPTEFDKMAYFLSRLSGEAKGQVKGGTSIHGQILFKTVAEIIEVLDAAFGDINAKSTAQKELFTQLQGNRSLASFLPKWQETCAEAQFGDEASIALLKRALHTDVTNRLSYIPAENHKTKLLEFISQVRGIDNILRNQDPTYFKKKATTLAAIPQAALSQPILTTTQGGSAMDVSVMEMGPAATWTATDAAAKRIPKTLNEREAKKVYCRANNLCNWCYDKNHTSTACPTAPWNAKGGKGQGKA